MTFEIERRYSAQAISSVVGGQEQYYISTVDGHVVAVKLRTRLNPDAPDVVLVGGGPRIRANARAAATQASAFPVFVADDDRPGFVFVGRYHGAGISTDAAVLNHFARRSGRDDLTAVLFLVTAEPFESVDVVDGRASRR